MLTDVTAFAPATVANVGIGFDILGHTVDAVGDRVRMRRIEEPMSAHSLDHRRGRRLAGRAEEQYRRTRGAGHARGAGAGLWI